MTQMKCCHCTKKSPLYHQSIKPQQLIAELNNGEIQNDDYFGRSFDLLPSINTSLPSRSGQSSGASQQGEEAFRIYELHEIIQPSKKSLEHGFTRMSDGVWYLASKTTLEHCTGEMIEWWFNHCDSTERFKWWHPTCNVHGEFDPTFYAVQPEDRLEGHAIGHRFTCVKKLYSNGGVSASAGVGSEDSLGEDVLQHIDYIHPAEFINTDELPAMGITACIIGKISYRDHHLGEISVGHVCHIVREHMGQVTLVTRMWLGSIDKTDVNFPSPRFVNYVGNTWIYRYMKFTNTFIKNIWTQMVQENNCLAAFLPDFYAQELIELEQKKLRNIALLEEAKNFNEFEEYSEDEVEEGQHYEEQSTSEDSNPDNLKDDGQQRLPSSTNDYGEESMSDEHEHEQSIQSQMPIVDAQLFQEESKNLALNSNENFYAYDSNEDEKGHASDDEGRGRSRRRSKSTGKSKSNRKAKSGSSAEVVSKVGGGGGGGGQQAVSSSALVSTSSRVGKGIGV